MKKYTFLILALVLTVTVLTGCGCRNSAPMDTVPTTMPTTETTRPTTQPTTMPTTEATRATEESGSTDSTIDNGNGPLPTDSTGSAGENDRARRIPGGF